MKYGDVDIVPMRQQLQELVYEFQRKPLTENEIKVLHIVVDECKKWAKQGYTEAEILVNDSCHNVNFNSDGFDVNKLINVLTNKDFQLTVDNHRWFAGYTSALSLKINVSWKL